MFGYSNMIPPQGVDRRGGIVTRGGIDYLRLPLMQFYTGF